MIIESLHHLQPWALIEMPRCAYLSHGAPWTWQAPGELIIVRVAWLQLQSNMKPALGTKPFEKTCLLKDKHLWLVAIITKTQAYTNVMLYNTSYWQHKLYSKAFAFTAIHVGDCKVMKCLTCIVASTYTQWQWCLPVSICSTSWARYQWCCYCQREAPLAAIQVKRPVVSMF